MIKITSTDGQIFVDNNEGNWSTKAKIWFKQGEKGKYRVVYIGH